MKIPREFKQFEDEKALLAVTAHQTASFYFASNGEIEEIKDMKIENPTYSDKEGFFIKSGHGDRYASGSVYESKDNKVRIDFLNQLESSLKEVVKNRNINKLYLFTPQHLAEETEKNLPYGVRELRVATLTGNFLNFNELDLLKKIKETYITE